MKDPIEVIQGLLNAINKVTYKDDDVLYPSLQKGTVLNELIGKDIAKAEAYIKENTQDNDGAHLPHFTQEAARKVNPPLEEIAPKTNELPAVNVQRGVRVAPLISMEQPTFFVNPGCGDNAGFFMFIKNNEQMGDTMKDCTSIASYVGDALVFVDVVGVGKAYHNRLAKMGVNAIPFDVRQKYLEESGHNRPKPCKVPNWILQVRKHRNSSGNLSNVRVDQFPSEDKSVRAYLKYLEEKPRPLIQIFVDSKPFFTINTDSTYDSHGNNLVISNYYDGVINAISARDRLQHQCDQASDENKSVMAHITKIENEPEILFRVKTDTEDFKIYTDGTTEGFPAKAYIFNHFSNLMVTLFAIDQKHRACHQWPPYDYKIAYEELREVWDDPKVQKALYFAHKNPELVYEKDSDENKQVKDGYFASYFFNK